MTTKPVTTTKWNIRLTALLTTLCLLLGLVPVVVLADEREPLTNDSIPISSSAFFKFIPTAVNSAGAEQKMTVFHNTSTDEYEIDEPVPMDGQFKAWFQMNGSGGRNRSNLYVKIVEDNTGTVVTTKDQNGTSGEYWINETTQPDLHVGGDGTKGKTYTLDPSAWLEPGTDYYFFVSKDSMCGNTTFGRDYVIHFRTDGESGPSGETPVDSVSLSETGLLFEGTGRTYDLTASVMPKNATDPTVTWSSSDPSIATVDANGKVTSVAPGAATITVTTNDGGKTATCPVTVRTSDAPRTLTKVRPGDILQNASGRNFRVDAPEVYRDVSTPGRLVVLSPVERTDSPTFVLAIYNVDGGTKSMSQHVNVYADAGLTYAVAKGGVVNENLSPYPEEGMTCTPENEKSNLIGTYVLDPSVLNDGTTYYFVMEADSTVGGGGQFGAPVIIEFTTAGEGGDPQPVPLTAALTADKTTAFEKETVALTAKANGGTAPYQYKFTVTNNDNGQSYVLQDYADGNTVDWYTAGAARKTLKVEVKDAAGDVAEATLPIVITKETVDPLTVTTFTSSKGTALTEKTTTTLRATATGGKTPYTYKFIVFNQGTKQWYKIRDFASGSTCDWYTGAPGTKTLYVDVKDGAGTVVRRDLGVTVAEDMSAPLAASYFTSSKGTTLNAGDTTNLVAKATGGTGSGYTYKFIVYNTQTKQWYKIQDYSTKSSASWYTGSAGTKVLYVDIKDSAGNYARTPLNVTVK